MVRDGAEEAPPPHEDFKRCGSWLLRFAGVHAGIRAMSDLSETSHHWPDSSPRRMRPCRIASLIQLHADHMRANIFPTWDRGHAMDQVAHTKVGNALAEDARVGASDGRTLRCGLEHKPPAGRQVLYG